jgi:hypothetical protein
MHAVFEMFPGGNEMNVNRRLSVLTMLLIFGLLIGSLGVIQPVKANGNNQLATSQRFLLRGDVVSAGVGLRGVGSGDITLSGVPAGAAVFRAYLYWATLGSANTFTSPTLNGEQVQGQLIGTSGDTCWGVQHNFVYRAEVTGLVDGGGTYSVAGLPDDLEAGNDSQGASLVVIYQDASAPFRNIIVHDGAVSLDFNTTNYTDVIQGFVPDDPITDAHITYLIGDGQIMWDSGNVLFNETPIAENVFSGTDGDFWGTHTFDVTDLTGNAPATTTVSDDNPGDPDSPDCLLWAATIFSVTTPVTAEETNELSQFETFSLHGDVNVSGVGLRGTGQGVITVTGVPAGAYVSRAFLYWATLGSSGMYTTPTLDGQSVTGEVIGISPDTCWGVLHNYAYRAEVTSIVRGNGSYTISGLPDDLSAGNDSQGAALVIVYGTSQASLYRTIVIDDGAVSLNFTEQTYTDTISSYTPDNPVTQARVIYMVGDGQSIWDNGNVTFNGTSIAENVFNGVDGDFWGTLSFDVTSLTGEAPATTTLNDENPGDPDSPDCLLWAGTVFSVTSPEPVFNQMLFLPIALGQ